MNRKPYLATALVLVSTLTAGTQEKKIDQASLPPAVRKTVLEQSKGATVTGFSTEVEHGKRTYEVEMMVNGHSRDIEVAEDGTLNEVEEEVAFSALPINAQRALTDKAAGAQITKVESLTKQGKLVAYEAATLKGTKRAEIQIAPNGGKLAHEE